MSKLESLDSVHSIQTLALDSSLSLIPRLKLILTVHRGDASIKPLDEWQLRRSLLDFCAANFSLTIPDDDLRVRRFKDLNKRKRHDPVAIGTLVVKDLGFLSKCDDGDVGKRYGEWRKSVVEKMDGMEVSIAGVKFRLGVELPGCDDFEGMVKEWEELIAFGGYSKGGRRQPDTIVLRGVPSRWFAEPRVSSKPSMLVTHTIFSAFGKIRNLDIAEDDDIGKLEEEDAGDIVPGLHCKIVVRFEEYRDFYNSLKVLSGRSLQKEGSRLRADYEVNWDKEGFLRDSRTHPEKSSRWALEERYKSEAPRRHSYNSHFSTENTRSKRFKE